MQEQNNKDTAAAIAIQNQATNSHLPATLNWELSQCWIGRKQSLSTMQNLSILLPALSIWSLTLSLPSFNLSTKPPTASSASVKTSLFTTVEAAAKERMEANAARTMRMWDNMIPLL